MTHVHDIAAGLPKHRNTVEFACMGGVRFVYRPDL